MVFTGLRSFLGLSGVRVSTGGGTELCGQALQSHLSQQRRGRLLPKMRARLNSTRVPSPAPPAQAPAGVGGEGFGVAIGLLNYVSFAGNIKLVEMY